MQVCNALANKTRFMMLKLLVEEDREICICEFQEFFEKDPSVLYRNIEKLKDAELISTRKDGRKLLSKVKNRGAVNKLIESIEEIDSGSNEEKFRELKA